MEDVLSIDATLNPIRACVVRLGAQGVEVIEEKTIDLDEAEFFALNNGSMPPPVNGSAPDQPAEAPAGPPPNSFTSLLRSISAPYVNSALFVRPTEFTSLSLDLPLRDPSALRKVIDLEVQDLVPFALDDFLVAHRVAAGGEEQRSDVHVSLVPKDFVRKVLSGCQANDFYPRIISPPQSALAALYKLFPDRFGDNTCIVEVNTRYCSMVAMVKGSIRRERLVNFPAQVESREVLLRDLGIQLGLSLETLEYRYESKIQKIILLGTPDEAERLKSLIHRDVEAVELSQLLPAVRPESTVAALGAVFAQDGKIADIPTNFRTREFAYRPQLKELKAGLRALLPYFGGAIAALIISLVGIYTVRSHRITSLQTELTAKLTEAIPGFNAPPGEELKFIERQNYTVDQQLKDLGSPSSYSPLEALVDISAILPGDRGVVIKHLSIKGTKIRLEGTAPDYAAVEDIEKAFKKRKDGLYSRIKKDASSGTGQTRSFAFEIFLNE